MMLTFPREFCLRHPEVRDVCDVGQMLFWGKTWAWYATAVMFILNNTFIQVCKAMYILITILTPTGFARTCLCQIPQHNHQSQPMYYRLCCDCDHNLLAVFSTQDIFGISKACHCFRILHIHFCASGSHFRGNRGTPRGLQPRSELCRSCNRNPWRRANCYRYTCCGNHLYLGHERVLEY